MSFSATFNYQERSFYVIKNLNQLLIFIIINIILAFIFLFLVVEEIDWLVVSFREKIDYLIVDKSTTNVKNIIGL